MNAYIIETHFSSYNQSTHEMSNHREPPVPHKKLNYYSIIHIEQNVMQQNITKAVITAYIVTEAPFKRNKRALHLMEMKRSLAIDSLQLHSIIL